MIILPRVDPGEVKSAVVDVLLGIDLGHIVVLHSFFRRMEVYVEEFLWNGLPGIEFRFALIPPGICIGNGPNRVGLIVIVVG